MHSRQFLSISREIQIKVWYTRNHNHLRNVRSISKLPSIPSPPPTLCVYGNGCMQPALLAAVTAALLIYTSFSELVEINSLMFTINSNSYIITALN